MKERNCKSRLLDGWQEYCKKHTEAGEAIINGI